MILTALRGTDEVENHDAYISGSDRKHLIITLGIILVTYLISMSTDCLGIVLELNGILAAVPLAYVLPALCYLRLEEGPLLSPKKLPALGLLLAGIFAAASGLLLLIFNQTASASCVHGGVMSYCQPANLTSSLASTLPTTPLTTRLTTAATKAMPSTAAAVTKAATTASTTAATTARILSSTTAKLLSKVSLPR